MGRTTTVRPWATPLLCGALIVTTAACSEPRSSAGSPTAPPMPTHGQVDVTMAFTDSFNVLSDGTRAGRHLNDGVRDGATVEVYGMSHPEQVAAANMSTHYVYDLSYRNRDGGLRPNDDGKYCVARFTFVPPAPDLQGYVLQFPNNSYGAPGVQYQRESFWSDVIGGRGYGSSTRWCKPAPTWTLPRNNPAEVSQI